tara:strand:- start:645 stop:1514 length:870 start_codon:yes stop_codon:yes gene_type:complete
MESPDKEYNKLVQSILHNGIDKDDRTGIGTKSIFGATMRFDLTKGFPLITSKRVYIKGVVEELLWMLRGSTNSNELSSKNVKIWDANGSKDFLKSQGLDYSQGTLGPIYGHQWRHFNAEYKGSDYDYTGQGIDQIAELIENIKNNPNSRRLIVSAWNPAQNHLMALPACHTLCQFYVDTNTSHLSCSLYQRSGDVGLGIPFNIASYALLTHIIAEYTNLKPFHFIHTIGDAHIYKNHIEHLKEQIKREEYKSPYIILNIKGKELEDIQADDIEIKEYKCHKNIKLDMAV